MEREQRIEHKFQCGLHDVTDDEKSVHITTLQQFIQICRWWQWWEVITGKVFER
jgi:hypothetical protein